MKWLSTTEEVIVSRARIQDGADRADALWNELDCSVTVQPLQFAVHGDTPPFLGARQLWWPTLTASTKGVQKDPGAFGELVARGGDNAVTLLTQSERILR